MNTILINSKTAATVAKALLPVIKNKQNIDQGLGVLSRVLIKDGYLWATDRYVAIRIHGEQLINEHVTEWVALEGKQLSLAQVEAMAKIRPNATPGEFRVTDNEITLDTWDGVQVTHTWDGLDFPNVAQFFNENDNVNLSHVSQSVSLATTLTKIATAVKASRILWQPSSKSSMLNVTLEGANIQIDVVSVNNVLKVS